MNWHPRILELMASRICHDLVSPVGAVANGIELFQELGDAAGQDALTLIADSAAQANIRLKVFRWAYGAAGTDKNLSFKDIREVFSDLIKNTRVQAEFSPLLDAGLLSVPRGFLKCTLNLLILAEECAQGEGRLHVEPKTATEAGIKILIAGRHPGFREGVEAALKGETTAEELTPRSIHAHITGAFIHFFGYHLHWQEWPDLGRLEFQLSL